ILARSSDVACATGLTPELQGTAEPREAKNYYPRYPGFEAVFRLPIARQDERLVLELPADLEEHARRGNKIALARHLFQCIAQLKPLRTSFDVAFVYLPPHWAACFEGEGFDFHDYLKAFCAPSNI